MKFYCSANEFYFCRVFSSHVSGSGELEDKLTELNKGGMKRTILLFLSAFPVVITLGITSNLSKFPLQTPINFVLMIIFLSLILSAFLNIRRANQEYRHFESRFINRPSTLNEEVMFYDVKPEGLYINLYNKSDGNDMILILWSEIEKGEVDYLRYPNPNRYDEKSSSRIEMIKQFKEVKKHHKDFRYTNNLTHRDKTVVRLYESEYSHNDIPLPYSWEGTEEKNRFIEELRKHVPIKVIEHKEIELLDILKKEKPN